MAANKFATMLHRNTNKMTLILVYTLLEWILILLLLLNSLFSYLIIKFADYFGLQPPCPWCSRVDHIIEPRKSNSSHRDHLCEAHATEISQLGFCSNHRKLVESRHMCEDCLSSTPEKHGISGDSDFFPKIELIQNYDSVKCCSCCGAHVYSPCLLIKPSWDDLDKTHKANVVAEPEDVEESDDLVKSSDFWADRCLDVKGIEEKDENCLIPVVIEVSDEKESITERDWDYSVSLSNPRVIEVEDDQVDEEEKEKDPSPSPEAQLLTREAKSPENHPQLLEFFLGHDGFRLIPVELIDSTTDENQNKYRIEEGDEEDGSESEGSESAHEARVNPVDENWSCLVEDVVEAEHSAPELKEDEEAEANFGVFGSMEIEENESSFIFHPKQCETFPKEDSYFPSGNSINEATEEEEFQILPINETEADVSIGTEIPDLEATEDEFQIHENIEEHDHGSNEDEQKPVSVDRECTVTTETPLISESNEIEEERVPDTPTSTDSFHHLHKKLLLLDRKESGTEESLDGSVISEFESVEGATTTVDRLKSALKAERKALHVLYTELEEERSASAIAANQTMAMINRLQEEKAAMQMEALQYQRMMDEQSEYDQEALQLLNELMVKREKEKQELEKELEAYRKKVFEYEAKEKMRFLRRSKDGGSSITRSDSLSPSTCSSSSNAGDSDGLSIDLSHETKEENDSVQGNSTPIDTVLNLDESLANFEDERMSILEELKALEEKLFTLTDEEEEQHYEDIKPIEEFYKENGGVHLNGNSDSPTETNGKEHHETRIVGVKGKRLLPLFDAISSEDAEENGHFNGFESDMSIMQHTSAASKGIEEEVDRLYERLHAFEADREFLKHCIGSLKKGDKGIDLLQEILQHLRDLKNVELRVRNLSDGAL